MIKISSTACLCLLLLSGPLLALSVRGFAPMLALAGFASWMTVFRVAPINRDISHFGSYRLPLAALAFMIASAIWGISDRSSDTAIRLVLICLFMTSILVAFNNLDTETRSKWGHLWSRSLIIGIIFSLIVGPYNFYWPELKNLLENQFELLRQVNSSLSILPIFLFLLLSTLPERSSRKSVSITILALGITFFVTLVSESQTSLLAVVLGLIGYSLARVNRIWCRNIIFTALAFCTLLSPPIFKTAYENNWVQHYAPEVIRVHGSGEIRQWLYHVYANESLNKPFLGHGINGSKYYAPKDLAAYATPVLEDKKIGRFATNAIKNNVLASHPHNLFLQLIFEFGYFGSILILAAVWVLFKKLHQVTPAAQAPFIWGSVGAALGTLMFGFTIWHSWLMAALATAILFAYVAIYPTEGRKI